MPDLVQAIDAFLAIHRGEVMEKLRRSQGAWYASVREMTERRGGEQRSAALAEPKELEAAGKARASAASARVMNSAMRE